MTTIAHAYPNCKSDRPDLAGILRVVPLDALIVSKDLQARVVSGEGTAADGSHVDDLAAALLDGVRLPPPRVYEIGGELLVTDGHHTCEAHRKAGRTEVEVLVFRGSLGDAGWDAAGANTGHGLTRTGADKRRATEMALSLRPDLSDREVARHVRVSHTFVAQVRRSNKSTGNGCHSPASAPESEDEGEEGPTTPDPTPHGETRPTTSGPDPHHQTNYYSAARVGAALDRIVASLAAVRGDVEFVMKTGRGRLLTEAAAKLGVPFVEERREVRGTRDQETVLVWRALVGVSEAAAAARSQIGGVQ
jgi:hypothetical protein